MKEELKNKINEIIKDSDTAISLLEYVEDNIQFEGTTDPENTKIIEESKQLIEKLQKELEDMKNKYKERFLTSNVENTESETSADEEEEDAVIDVSEI